jgi:hypothetical protein
MIVFTGADEGIGSFGAGKNFKSVRQFGENLGGTSHIHTATQDL